MLEINDADPGHGALDSADEPLLPPEKKAKLVEQTLAAAMRNRHPLELCWGGVAEWPESSRVVSQRTIRPARANF